MSSIETKNALSAAKPFRYLNPQELEMLLAYCKIVTFASRELILHQGKKSDCMYIILKGKAVITVKILGKEVIELATLEAGDFIGEVSLIERGQCASSVMANTEIECLLISTNYFDTLSLLYPEIKYKISKAIVEGVYDRINILRQKITVLMKESNMIGKSIFGEIISSLTRPEIITYEHALIEKKHLRNFFFFKNLSDQNFEEFLNHTELIRAAANCALIKEGEKDAPYFLVIRGAVQTSFTEHGRTAKIAVLGPENIFGGFTYINNAPSIISYTTCERSILLKINLIGLDYFQKNNILLWYKIFDPICKSFVELERSADKLLMRLNVEFYNR